MPEIPPASQFAKKLASIAQGQFDKFHTFDEKEETLSDQIAKYWTTIGLKFPGVKTAWSAVFISYCVKRAGATKAEFKFAASHSVFVNEAIANKIGGTGVFRAFKINEESVRVGDIIQNNRLKHKFDYEFAKENSRYESHSAIVVSRGEDSKGKFAMTVGGNESGSVSTKRVDLNDDGTIKQRVKSPFICIIKNLK